MSRPRSCDTFVALPPGTAGGNVIFGKNSDRPSEEVQEVIHFPAADHPAGSKVQCTFIEIEQVEHTYACMLSRPSWLWGAEMGANEHGVCIGNEAVWSKMSSSGDRQERLLGMDLVRLGLERSSSAKEAVDVLCVLLESHGLGGLAYHDPNPSDEKIKFSFASSFLICDKTEAWVLEAVDRYWATEKISCGVRNISNQLTIRTKIDAMSEGLKEHAQEKGWWNPDDGEFDFAKVYSDCFEETELDAAEEPSGRQQCGTKLLTELSNGGDFSVESMFKILRDEDSGICMSGYGICTTGSQVSLLSPAGTNAPCCHWFTATPNPAISMFKPFIFCEHGVSIGDKTVSPTFGEADPVKTKPRFQTTVDRRHELWKAHEVLEGLVNSGDKKGDLVRDQMAQLEAHCVHDMADVLANFDEKSMARVAEIFKHMVDLEINFYK